MTADSQLSTLPEPDIMCDCGGNYYTESQVHAMMAERDAAREEAAGLRAELAQRNKSPSDRLHNICAALEEDADNSPFSREAWDELEAEAAALRRELEELRKAARAAYESIDADGRNEPEMVAVLQALGARPIPPDAREGREPLTEAQIEREFWTREFPCVDTSHRKTVLSLYTQRNFYIKGWKAAHGIGPAGTSADGETQP